MCAARGALCRVIRAGFSEENLVGAATDDVYVCVYIGIEKRVNERFILNLNMILIRVL